MKDKIKAAFDAVVAFVEAHPKTSLAVAAGVLVAGWIVF